MKAATDLKKLYVKWKHIDTLYMGQKSDWREIHSNLLSVEFRLKELSIRDDGNRSFCEYIRQKMTLDIRYEIDRLENQYGEEIFR